MAEVMRAARATAGGSPGSDVNGGRRRWLVLAAGTLAQAVTSMYQFGIPSVLPQVRSELGLSLGQASLVIVCPSVGLVSALIAWGAFADRFGERLAMTTGLVATAVSLGIAGTVHTSWGLAATLVAAGATGASVNSASGRAVAGWFDAHERGLAMGARQTAQPIGVGVAALVLPVAAGPFGYRGAMLVAAAACLVTAGLVAAAVHDPPRPPSAAVARPPSAAVACPPSTADARPSAAAAALAPRAAGARTQHAAGARSPSPYRTPVLWRIHGASALLIVPQFAMSTFGFVFLVGSRHWSAGAAGGLLAAANAIGALSRLLAGAWSDRVADRLGPMRALALGNTVVVGLLAASTAVGAAAASAALLAGAVAISVSGNGLAFTTVAELAGPHWAGRALGAHNTAQSVISLTSPPLLGLLITGAGYASAFAVAAAFAACAIAVIPSTDGNITWGTSRQRL